MVRLAWLLCMLACGCTQVWTAQAVQPRLVLAAPAETRTSVSLTIAMRDMDTGRFLLRNTAYYVVVSRDRLRFHVTLHHKWDEFADLETWTAYVEDAAGVRHYPEDMSADVHSLISWKRNGRTYVMHRPMYRGTADFTIYQRDLFDVGDRLTLVLTRPGTEYRYRWISGPTDGHSSYRLPE